MACTIISTPSVGASDWTDFITQVEKQRKGYMAVSLTNYAASAASNIASGSVMELSGSFYTFTDTSIALEAGAASADVAVYYVATPSAGGTTCTITMDDTAPEEWVDGKQGWYASAASLSRYLGGCYIGTAGVYYAKWLYEKQRPGGKVKIGNFSRSSAGNLDITDVGFQPSIVFFFATDNTVANVNLSLGFDDAVAHHCIGLTNDGTEVSRNTDISIRIWPGGGNIITGHIGNWRSDGFRVVFTLEGTVTANIIYLALP